VRAASITWVAGSGTPNTKGNPQII
jgi:hypothetical protein